MENLTNIIAGKIADELKLDNDNKEIIAYGTFALMQIALSIVLIIVFGIIFKVLNEALIISFAGSILRKYSGGAHASSPGKCAIIGTFICIGLALLFSLLIGPLTNSSIIVSLGLVIFSLSYYFIYKLAPVDSLAKPIKTNKKKIRMRKRSIFVLSIYLIIVVINIVMSTYYRDRIFLIYSLCIYGGVVWQVFTLSTPGHRTMNKIDTFLDQILKFRRGVK